jgi:hypothetical protein
MADKTKKDSRDRSREAAHVGYEICRDDRHYAEPGGRSDQTAWR